MPFHAYNACELLAPAAAWRAPAPQRSGLAGALLLMLAACGGGGGGGNGGGGGGSESMSLSTRSVSVSASTVDPTPTAQLQASINSALVGASYYVAASTTNTGIASINIGSLSSAAVPTANIVITFKAPGSLGLGVYKDTVTISACYDQACTRLLGASPQSVAVQYQVIQPMPSVTVLQPSAASVGGGAFALTVYGTEFTPAAVVNWNGSPRATTYVTSTQLTAQIGASDLTTSGTIPVTVTNPGVATSQAATFTVNPVVLTSVSPTFVAAGGPAFALNVFGSGFASASVAQWNGSARVTTFVSATQLQAQITPADIATAGSASVTVVTPSAAGAPSTPVSVTIGTLPVWPASTHAVAYQINAAHTGSVTFSAVTFPGASTWTVDLGATVSYALIANGKVFVTATTSGGNSNLYALDQTTGGTAWGPIAIPGVASPAYDNGVVFVTSATGPEGFGNGSIQAYEATTGTLLWNTAVSGLDAQTASAPTALNGYVYLTGDGANNSGTFALNESTGAVAWSVLTGNIGQGNSSPAVGAGGVYVDFACIAYAYSPATGQQLWSFSSPTPPCDTGLGSTPFLVGNTVYAPMTGAFGGPILAASSGVATGSYSAGVPPVFDSQNGYFVQNQPAPSRMLQAISLSSGVVQWTFAGEPNVCAAMVVSQYVIAAGCSGNIYGLDAGTGQQLWLTSVPTETWSFTGELPLQALAAGDGMLLIPAGTKLVAYTLAMTP